ncbi:MAG: hypothetical protein JU82_10100 [Sulfuricurvum sp. MLSB]|uniref:AAA family ATPase n=1 Tax=unclassified Sulfuricurvum TaxID=2632390 RepID=UPI000501D4B4|nr:MULTISPECIES: AAA family ATPase [unclassified Sulfuricurvum]KFN38792.1 MAG: hypothetical protein JU82_10100 [Sulfuricurvum sp. MLSB]
MELVYLWVEKYKNIHNQGFNFSSRFKCSYENDELNIIDKEETKEPYLKNFFSDNINVTAIVGKNGSGKSSIQKLIFVLIFFKKFENNFNTSSQDIRYSLINLINNFVHKNIFLIVNINNQRKKISLRSSIYKLNSNKSNYDFLDVFPQLKGLIPCAIDDQYEELNGNDINFFNTHFNYMIDTWYDGWQDQWIKRIYHRTDGYDIPLLLEPYKGHYNQIIDIDNLEYLNNQKVLALQNKIKDSKQITSFFKPNKLYLQINYQKLADKYMQGYGYTDETEIKNTLMKEFQDLDKINKLYIALKILTTDKKNFHDETIQTKLKSYYSTEEYATDKDTMNAIVKFVEENHDQILKIKDYSTEKLQNCVDMIKNNADFHYLYNLTKTSGVSIQEYQKHFAIIPPWVSVEFYADDKKYSALSGGEKMFFSFMINLLYQVNNVQKSGKYNTINIFLDEVEFGLHPDWQKRFVEEILFSLQDFTIKINILFATHSPFILSDIPRENVIFLEDGKQIDVKIDTFGANIHTLLSHGFFMDDGLMGEFAKEKINEVIKLLKNKRKLSQKNLSHCENIISIIGEPVLQKTLQNMLNEKKSSHLTKLEKLQIQQKEIEEQINALEKRL